ncbi:MAG: cation-transporting P-type ATPase [bacterium]|nr:cation-transporting P-type ATPase [bacterium]
MNRKPDLFDTAQLKLDDLFNRFESTENGLTLAQARARWHENGPNELPQPTVSSVWLIMVRQFANVLILLLVIAAGVSWLVGRHQDTVFIVIALLINAGIGFWHEYQSARIVASLSELAAPTARTRRNRELKTIAASELVPGDIILLTAGDRVPADARLMNGVGLEVDESSLTGESLPQLKEAKTIKQPHRLLDLTNTVLMGTHVVRGRGVALVVATGITTQIGIINQSIAQAKTPVSPLQEQIAGFTKKIALIISLATVGIFLVGILTGQSLPSTLLSSISLAVAAIPEGLPVLVTVVLVIGIRKMADERALVKKLSAVETLGQVQVLITDKTGTLTQNSMAVSALLLLQKKQWQHLAADTVSSKTVGLTKPLQAAVLANEVINRQGTAKYVDPIDQALIDFATPLVDIAALQVKYPTLHEIPFDSEQKFMASIHQTSALEVLVYLKGAPQVLRSLCRDDNRQWWREVTKISSQGEKVVATGECRLTLAEVEKINFETKALLKLMQDRVHLTGLVAFSDPLRPESVNTIALAQQAQIRVVMATGDLKPIAYNIAQRLNIKRSDVRAEITPIDKLNLISQFQQQKLIVAMTGDGVNDAPALKQADVGLAMGYRGSDVARAAADIVILDDSIDTIIKAVRSGRTIFRNIQRVVSYYLATNIAEVSIVGLSILSAGLLPLPLLPVHILWINLVTDGFTVLPLAFEPDHEDAMSQPPRHRRQPLLPPYFWRYIWFTNFVLLFLTIAAFLFSLRLTHNLFTSQSVAFSVLALGQIFNFLNARSIKQSFFKLGVNSNPATLISFFGSLALHYAIFLIPSFRTYISLAPLSFGVLILLTIYSSLVFWLMELYKRYHSSPKS